jgi:site-specific DNA-cytosine methylase
MASEVDFLIPCAVDPRNDRVTPIVGTLMSGGHGWSPNMINPVLVDVAAIDCRNLYENHELSGTLQAKSNGSYSLNYTNPIRIGYGVRRLTPRECERLQGFPDDWTAPGSDSKRYQAMGDSIAIPVFSWLFKRIKRELERGDA